MIGWWRKPGKDGGLEEGDPVVSTALVAWDPAAADPGYWLRFQGKVLALAAPELARRRLMADLTVGDVLAGWARALIPTAALAAGVALVVIVQPFQSRQELTSTTSVEELLVAGMGRETIPETLSRDEPAAWVTFAGERF